MAILGSHVVYHVVSRSPPGVAAVVVRHGLRAAHGGQSFGRGASGAQLPELFGGDQFWCRNWRRRLEKNNMKQRELMMVYICLFTLFVLILIRSMMENCRTLNSFRNIPQHSVAPFVSAWCKAWQALSHEAVVQLLTAPRYQNPTTKN